MPNAPAAGHALEILTLLARHATPVAAATIARELELPRSSTYHLLTVLIDQGYVVHLPEVRRYGLGVAAFELGSAYTRQAPLQRLAQPRLTRLADSTGHNAHLAVLHGADVLYVIEERVAGRPSLVSDVGVRLPATLTASGLAILAALPPAQVRALLPSREAFVQRHGVGPRSPSELRRELSATRTRGYAHEDGLITPGLASVAAEVRDHTGHPVAGVAVTFPTDPKDPAGPAPTDAATAADHGSSGTDALVARVRHTARELSERLGHRG